MRYTYFVQRMIVCPPEISCRPYFGAFRVNETEKNKNIMFTLNYLSCALSEAVITCFLLRHILQPDVCVEL
jgi:hypothetical protein